MKKGEKKEKEKKVNKVIKAGPVGVLRLHCVELHDGSPPAKYALSSQSWYYLESNFSECSTMTFRLKKEREKEREIKLGLKPRKSSSPFSTPKRD